MNNPRPGSVIEVDIEKAVYRGLGLGRLQGQVVFVGRTLPGERVRARVQRTTKGYLRAALEEVLVRSPHRRTSSCPYAVLCGGCTYREVDYPAQLEIKRSILRETLARGGVSWEGEIPFHPSPEDGWRVRCAFHVEDTTDGGARLGFKEEGGGRTVDLPRCGQLSESLNGVLDDLRRGLAAHRHLARHVRRIDLIESPAGGRMVASVQTTLSAGRAVEMASLAEDVPGLTGFGAVTSDGRFLLLRGQPQVEAQVGGVRFDIHVGSFFQANRFLVERLVSEVADRIPPGGTVLDLFAGVGLFARCLASRAERVLGAELDTQSAQDARDSLRGLDAPKNVRIEHAEVGQALAVWPREADEHIILDPPRTGAGGAIVKAIAERRPTTVVYVSCDPPTLARDLKTFSELGYRPASMVALDLFPDTFHLETVIQLLPA